MTAIFMSRRRGISLNFHPIWRGFLSIAPVQKDRVVGGKRGRGGGRTPGATHSKLRFALCTSGLSKGFYEGGRFFKRGVGCM